jgi:hypothetical protein
MMPAPEIAWRLAVVVFLTAIQIALFATALPDQNAAILTSDAFTEHVDRHDVFIDEAHLSKLSRPDIAFGVQEDLEGFGFDPGMIDGIPAGRTRAAVRRFRAWVGVPGDDHITRDLIMVIHDEQGP